MDHFRALAVRSAACIVVVLAVLWGSRSLGADSDAFDRAKATFGGQVYAFAPIFSFDGVAPYEAALDRGCQYLNQVAPLRLQPGATSWDSKTGVAVSLCEIKYYNGDADTVGSWHGYAQMTYALQSFCPIGYTFFRERGADFISGDCRKPKPCAYLGTFTCDVEVTSGSAPIPSRSNRNNCAMSVRITGCVPRIFRSASNEYSTVDFCSVTETPVEGSVAGLQHLACSQQAAGDQDPCQVPGNDCSQPAGSTCPPGFREVAGVCLENPDNPDGCPMGTHKVANSCVSDEILPPCPAGQARGGSDGKGACSTTGNGTGTGTGTGTGGSGSGAGKDDVKCGATGDLCQSKFQEYFDAIKEYFGADPAARARGDALRESAQSAEATPNNLNTGPKIAAPSGLNTSGFVSHSCPAPVSLQLLNRTISLPFDKLCEFAAVISGLLIGFASLNAARIVAGAAA